MGKVNLKTFWKKFILDAIKNICDSGEEIKISALTGVWKKLILTLRDEFKGFRTSGVEVAADVVERARDLDLEVEPEGVPDLLQSHHESNR